MPRPKTRASRVRVSGPLAPYIAEFASKLEAAGYSPLSAVTQMRLLVHLSRWLDASQLDVNDLTEERIAEFFTSRRAAGCTWLVTRRALAPLLEMFSELGVLPAPAPPAADSPLDLVFDRFHRYLLDERGLGPSTADAYVFRARRFLAGCARGVQLEGIIASDVTRAVLAESTSLSVGAAQYFVAALRAFLRFCSMEGLVTADLSGATLAVTGRRRSSLPNGMSSTDTESLLRSCDGREAVGRRDYAVLVVLLRLGLRVSEVAGLRLDDLDWRAAELVVHGKGRHVSRLPLPTDVGEAIAEYLQRDRPNITRREVFLSAIAPIGALGRGGVASIVRRACRRAGVTPVGPHRLRHTMACNMLRTGVPLAEISQVLRHRSLASTAIYARADLDQLRGLAQPWPGGAAR